MANSGHYKSWKQAVVDTFSSWKFGFVELSVVVALLIFIILVIYLYDRFCDSHVDPNVELEPTELEMRELPRPFVDFPLIDYVRLNQREFEPLINEEDTYSTASTIPLDTCVMITENIRRSASQDSIWIEHEEEDEEEDEHEEENVREPERVIVDPDAVDRDIVEPDTVERIVDNASNTDVDTPIDEEGALVTHGSETETTDNVNPSVQIAAPIEDRNSPDSVAISIENDHVLYRIVIPVEDD